MGYFRELEEGVPQTNGHHPAETPAADPPPAPRPTVDDDEFWNSRPALAHVRQFMQARRASPWAGLGVVLVRVSAATPPHYVLPAIIGGHGSLNLFLGVVARSGGGKGASEVAAADAVNVGPIPTAGVGSGEGLLHQYVHRVRASKSDGLPGGIEQHADRVIFTASEVDTLAALKGRQGSTLLPELRKIWMGESLSFAYVDPTKRLALDAHRYRAGLIIGIQPERASVLLEDAPGGTPQRFLWLPGTDPLMPDTAPEEPEPWTWALPRGRSDRPDGRIILDVCATALETVDAEHRRRNRGDGDALDGHTLFCQLKVAAALALLEQRLDVSDEDWQLADAIMQKSLATREGIVAELREQWSRKNRARALADADRDIIRDEKIADTTTRRVCAGITRKLTTVPEMNRGDLRKAFSRDDRHYFDAAVELLIESGQVETYASNRTDIYRLSNRAR